MGRTGFVFLFVFFLIFFVGIVSAVCDSGQCEVGEDGCLDNGDVYDGQYCSFEGVLTNQASLGDNCFNDFECFDSECIENICAKKSDIILGSDLEITLWDRILGKNCIPGQIIPEMEGISWRCEGNLLYTCGAYWVWEGGKESALCNGVVIKEVCTPETEEIDCIDIPEPEVTCSLSGEVINQSFLGECILLEGKANSCNYVFGDFEVLENCTESGKVCSGGECIIFSSCTPGEEKCSNLVNNICNASGAWVAQAPVNGVCGYDDSGETSSNSMRIVVSSPQTSVTYSSTVIPLEVYDSKGYAKYWRYSLNGGSKVSFVPNSTFVAKEGSNTIVISASKSKTYSSESSVTIKFNVLSSSGGPCGDGSCGPNENSFICPEDCSLSRCGDGVCSLSESSFNCPEDCEVVEGSCGDGVCDYSEGENSNNCIEDCEVVKPKNYWWLFVVILILILLSILVVIFFIVQRLKEKSDSSNSVSSSGFPPKGVGPSNKKNGVGPKIPQKRSFGGQPTLSQGNIKTMPKSSASSRIPTVSSSGNITVPEPSTVSSKSPSSKNTYSKK